MPPTQVSREECRHNVEELFKRIEKVGDRISDKIDEVTTKQNDFHIEQTARMATLETKINTIEKAQAKNSEYTIRRRITDMLAAMVGAIAVIIGKDKLG